VARSSTHAVRKRAIGGLVAFVLLVAPTSARACSCAAIDNETRFRLRDGAIIGKLLKVVRHGRAADFRYRIKEAFKARRRFQVGELLTIRAASDGAACGLPQGVGRNYGLFLRRADGRWLASLCDVTSPRTMREAAANGKAAGRSAACGLS
jgi:hypothetical protein